MGTDAVTRVTHVYGMRGVAPTAVDGGQEAERVLSLGYYSIHTQGPRTSGLRIVEPVRLDVSDVTFEGEPDDPSHLAPAVDVQVWVDALGHAQLHLAVESTGSITQLAAHLRAWCGRRHEMRLQGRTLPEWLADRVTTTSKGADWDQDVLQIVWLPEDLATPLSKEVAEGSCADVTRLVYRNPDSDYFPQPGRLKTPPELNHELGELAAHGRGVVVLGGHRPDRVATLAFIAAQLLFALARVRGIRIDVEQKLRDMRSADGPAASHWLNPHEITALSETVRQMRIRLAVDVEAFADGIYMPEIVLDDFRHSYANALHLGTVVESTNGMLDSLSDVAEVYRSEAQLLIAEQRQQLQRRWQRLATVASAVVVPLTLALSYFGVSSSVDAPSARSIFDLGFYWPVWMIAVLLVIAIVAVTYGAGRERTLSFGGTRQPDEDARP